MKLTLEEQRMPNGERGRATQKALEILVALSKDFNRAPFPAVDMSKYLNNNHPE